MTAPSLLTKLPGHGAGMGSPVDSESRSSWASEETKAEDRE
jgi:hypothetical protein